MSSKKLRRSSSDDSKDEDSSKKSSNSDSNSDDSVIKKSFKKKKFSSEIKMCNFYKISNMVNDYIYIGSTTRSLENRFAQHKRVAKIYPKRPLYKMFNEIGDYNFYIELLESYVCNTYSRSAREDYWINRFDTPKLNKAKINIAKEDENSGEVKINYEFSTKYIKDKKEKRMKKEQDERFKEEKRIKNMKNDELTADFIKNRDQLFKALNASAKKIVT
jgi:hypothetical protein